MVYLDITLKQVSEELATLGTENDKAVFPKWKTKMVVLLILRIKDFIFVWIFMRRVFTVAVPTTSL